jgi:hypothetical protein
VQNFPFIATDISRALSEAPASFYGAEAGVTEESEEKPKGWDFGARAGGSGGVSKRQIVEGLCSVVEGLCGIVEGLCRIVEGLCRGRK